MAFLDNDDELVPFALETCVAALNRDDGIDVIYSDEDKLDYQGERGEPFFKPDWSPSLLREVMYVGHLLMVRLSLMETIGGLNSTYDGVQDYELMLRLSEHTRSIHHVGTFCIIGAEFLAALLTAVMRNRNSARSKWRL